ncbi:hypothetical protein C4D60_Mb07t03580 [Musa balbisiana]|uniref:SHSP domain-containing protein n=1 Tax=Musa balbisiana TaxID=52838 RepID=A0A4S8JDW2_MUSBA|nr:hypothetical protein C4D60_Mb07t03580 [Musa balbisiana]
MDARLMGLDGPLMSTLHHLVDLPDEVEKALNAPTRTYVRDARAMAATPADVKELPGVYVFVVDMPELKPNEIKVQVEDDCVLVVSGERRRKEEEEEVKYLRMERRMGWASSCAGSRCRTTPMSTLSAPRTRTECSPSPSRSCRRLSRRRRRPSKSKLRDAVLMPLPLVDCLFLCLSLLCIPCGTVKYLRMERRMGKFMRRFSLPDNANVDVVSATYKDGVLTITVEKLPPPEPKKTKTIEVKVA